MVVNNKTCLHSWCLPAAAHYCSYETSSVGCSTTGPVPPFLRITPLIPELNSFISPCLLHHGSQRPPPDLTVIPTPAHPLWCRTLVSLCVTQPSFGLTPLFAGPALRFLLAVAPTAAVKSEREKKQRYLYSSGIITAVDNHLSGRASDKHNPHIPLLTIGSLKQPLVQHSQPGLRASIISDTASPPPTYRLLFAHQPIRPTINCSTHHHPGRTSHTLRV